VGCMSVYSIINACDDEKKLCKWERVIYSHGVPRSHPHFTLSDDHWSLVCLQGWQAKEAT
jgi:hypothetical protein